MPYLSRRNFLSAGSLTGLGMFASTSLLTRSMFAVEPRVTVPAYNHVTDAQEIELGRKFAAEIEKSQQVVHNSVIESYLGGIVQRLAKQSQRPNLPYSIKLVNTYDVNAFSLAGGFLYLNRGLVEYITSEDEMVATLAHELGHVVARHSINGIVRSFAARQLLNTVLENLFKKNGVVEQIIAQFGGAVAMLALLHFSREDELEADMLGFYEMLRAGYDPHGFEKLFAQFEAMERKTATHASPYLSSHPPTPQREAAIRRELTEVRVPSTAKSDSLTFHVFKTVMGALPEPPKPARR